MKTLDWTIRTGPVDYAHPYDASRVKLLGDGWVRLALNNQRMSAGLLGPKVERGIYRFEIRGRLDNFDPAPVFSIWTYDDPTANEQDWIEVDRARDPNNMKTFRLSEFVGGNRVYTMVYGSRAFNRYELTAWTQEDLTTVMAQGFFPSGSPTPVVEMTWLRAVNPIGHQLRMGFWLPKTGYVFADTNSRGPRVIDVRGTFEAFDSDTGDGGG